MTGTGTWCCSQCGEPVSECNGKCGKGTTAERTKSK